MAKELLKLENLSKFYTDDQSVTVGLDHVDLSFCVGEFVAVTGESGSGKSTLAHVIGGILRFEGGEMYLDGKPTSHYDGSDWEHYRRERISFISQNYGILPGCSVLTNVISALRLSGFGKSEARSRAKEILEQVELWELRHRRGGKLSSGQKQRLSIARALAKPAPVLLADEPTGNLDGENSAKVIKLLAEAAKERLVILITHEFSEAEDYATRRIELSDGTVRSDVALRPAQCPKELPRVMKERKRMEGYVAGIQLAGRPVWSGMLLLFFALTAFAVFALLGTFLVALDDTDTRIYDNSAFRNGSRERIVVIRQDGAKMTQEDLERVLQIEYVESVERYGYAADVNYAYRENVDYQYHYSLASNGQERERDSREGVSFPETGLFVRSVPVYADGREFVSQGRIPEGFFEVLASDPELLGTSLKVYVQDRKTWNRSAYLELEMMVVGVTEQGSGLYFSDAFANALNCHVCTGYALFLPEEKVPEGEVLAENRSYTQLKDKILTFLSYGNFQGDPIPLLCAGSHDHPNQNCFAVNPGIFEQLVPEQWMDQFSLTIEDYAYTDRVLEELSEQGYGAISPFRECSARQDPVLAQQRTQTLSVCLGALAVVLALQVVVLRSMFGMQIANYRILSDIGLDCRTAGRSLLLQNVVFTLAGQLVGFALVFLLARAGVERIASVTRYLPMGRVLLLCAVHLGACCISGGWMMRILRRQVYPFSGVQTDLDFEGVEL